MALRADSWKRLMLTALAVLTFATTSQSQRRRPDDTSGSGDPEWKSWGTSFRPQIPENAVTSGGSPALFVCRSTVGQALVPGQLLGGQCQVALNQQVVAADNFEVLVGDRSISWVPYGGPAGNVPAAVVRGGREGQTEFIICRGRSAGGVFLGHAVDDARRCLFVENGKATLSDNFDFLIKGSARGQQAEGRTFERSGDGRQCDLTKASLNFQELFPADGRMSRQPIFIKGIPNPTITKVEQDECVYGLGSGDEAPDAAIGPGGKSVVVRSQRMEPTEGGDGRIYTIHFSAPGCGDSTLSVCVPTVRGIPCKDSTVRYDSSSPATSGNPACDPKCKDAEPSIAKLAPGQGEWVKVELTRISGYTITGVTQDECRDGVASARVSGKAVELRNKFNADGDGRVYTISFRCANGELSSVKVRVPKTGAPDAVDSGGTFDATVAEVDEQCCAPTLDKVDLVYIPGKSDLTNVTLRTSAESRITKVTQDECVDTEFDGKITTTNTVQIRNERSDGGDGRVYTFHYQCGGKERLVSCNVPIDARTKSVDSGQKYDSTITSTAAECNQCDKSEVLPAVITTVNGQMQELTITSATDYAVTSVFQDECVIPQPDATISGNGKDVSVRAEFDPAGDGRVYWVSYNCGGKPYTREVRVPKPGAAASSAVNGRYDSTKVSTERECDPCGRAEVSAKVISAPNHQMQTIAVNNVTDYAIVKVEQDECVGGMPGDLMPDAEIQSNRKSVALRSEFDAKGDGRVYLVSFQCGGNTYTQEVHVPKTGSPAAVLSPARFDSMSTVPGPGCGDNNVPTDVTCTLKRPDAATTPSGGDYCLWPPNHSETPLGVLISATDDVTPANELVYKIVGITSDEATSSDTGSGGPNKFPDAGITSANLAWFRAERSGNGDGRVYQVKVSATDRDGNVGLGFCQVKVPHDQGAKDCSTVVDSGQKFDATVEN